MVTRITREKMRRIEYGLGGVGVKDWNHLTPAEMFKVRDQIRKHEQSKAENTIEETIIEEEEVLLRGYKIEFEPLIVTEEDLKRIDEAQKKVEAEEIKQIEKPVKLTLWQMIKRFVGMGE